MRIDSGVVEPFDFRCRRRPTTNFTRPRTRSSNPANFRIAPLARPDLVERLATPFIASPGSATTLSLSRPHLPVTKATSYPIARGSQIPITQRAAPFYLCRPAVSSLETYQTPALGACLTVK